MDNYGKITALYSRLSVGDEDRDGGESNSIVNQENICQGGFHPKDEILPINRKLSYTSVRVTAAF